MNQAGTANGFLFLALLHGTVVAIGLFLMFALREVTPPATPIFELVAGEGDNYGATVAPKLGTPGGVKIDLPTPPAPPTPAPAPVKPETSPVEATPVQPVAPEPVIERAPAPAAAKPAPDAIPNISKTINRVSQRREKRILDKYHKQQAAEERKAKEEELKNKRLTKEEFDRLNQKVASSSTNPHAKHVDVDGIRQGVTGGSSDNTTGGAGGTALTREQSDDISAYKSLLAEKVKAELDDHPGIGAGLVVDVEIRIQANGTITGFRIVHPSGSAEFDRAVREAFRVIQMPDRPKGMPEAMSFPIRGVQ